MIDALLPLAVWRLFILLRYDRGPYAISRKLREWLDFLHDDEGKVISSGEGELAQIVDCPWCFSLWAIPLFLLVRAIYPPAYRTLVMILAGSQVTGLLADARKRGLL